MHKINLSQKIVDEFYISIQSLFSYGKLKKNEKKIKWEISYSEIDKLIKKKLQAFDSQISFEKIIKADYAYLKKIAQFINTNQKIVELKTKEKDYFFTLYSRLKKPEHIKKLDIKVCPYCNRNYIFNFTKGKDLNATAQLDHFFDKKTYPFLAVSVYNLIPSCSTCNQRKSAKQEDIFYPFLESFNDHVKFEYKGIKNKENSNNSNFFDEDRILLELKPISEDEKVKNHIEVFNLQNLYNEHKDIVSEILIKSEIYNESYIEELMQNYEGTLFKNREDLLRLVFGGYISDEDLGKRPLSKLTKDILEQLELL